MFKKLTAIMLLASLLLTGCAAPEASQHAAPEAAAAEKPATSVQPVAYRAQLTSQPIAPLDDSFVSGINSLGFSAAPLLFNTGENLAFSPASISLALCMTREGANGDTKDGMSAALGLESLTDEQIRNACKSLMWRANTGGMEAADAIWLSKDYSFSEPFLTAAMQDYFADAFPLIVPGAMDAVNAWADEKTHGRINQILNEEVASDTPILLANALYFLGDWERPFEAGDTSDGEFAVPGGPVTVPFMRSNRGVPYYANDDFSMISLNFKSEADQGRYAMAFILPAEGKSLAELLPRLDAGAFKMALSEAKEQEVWIRLPKFDFEYYTSLRDTLIDLGMEQAFSRSEADFSAMTDQPNSIYIGDVLHKCYVRIDELGAEAAAVTVVEMEAGAAMQVTEPPKFYADRPFLFAIYSLEDGTIAFLGAVNDPS